MMNVWGAIDLGADPDDKYLGPGMLQTADINELAIAAECECSIFGLAVRHNNPTSDDIDLTYEILVDGVVKQSLVVNTQESFVRMSDQEVAESGETDIPKGSKISVRVKKASTLTDGHLRVIVSVAC